MQRLYTRSRVRAFRERGWALPTLGRTRAFGGSNNMAIVYVVIRCLIHTTKVESMYVHGKIILKHYEAVISPNAL